MIWTLVENGLVIFDWLVLRMRMQVILDSFSSPEPTSLLACGRNRFLPQARRILGSGDENVLDSFRSPGFSPYMGRGERRVQGLD